MGFLEQVKFQGLDFSICPDLDLESFLIIAFVHLEDVSDLFIAGISKFVDVEPVSVLRITRSPLPDLYNFGNVV